MIFMRHGWMHTGTRLRRRRLRHSLCHPRQRVPTKPPSPTDPTMPPGWRRGEAELQPFVKAQWWGCFTSATKHYGSSGLGPRLGERRVEITSCGILNYYSPEFQSQALARAGYEQKKLNLTNQGLWLEPKENKGQWEPR